MAGQQFVRWGYGGQNQLQTGPSSSTAPPDSTLDDPSSVTVSSRRRSSHLSSSSPPITGSDEEESSSMIVDPLDLSSTCNNLNNNSTSSSSSGKTFITEPGRWNRTSLHPQQIAATASSSNLQHCVQDQNNMDCVMATSAGNKEQPSTAASPSVAVTNHLSMMGSSAAGVSGGTDEAHKCDMCGKTFAVPARLTRHYRTHTGERPFVCEVCGKSFSVKENLSVHRRIHTKEKPYRCPHCGRGFEHSGKLHRHMRIHTGERPHQCTDCGKTFIQSGQLVIHMRSHTGEKPYVCTVCNKGFTCSKQLKVHSRTHTGERPYACDVCGKTFAYNHVLKLHQMAHLGERLYKCTLCAETYSSKKALEAHIKTHGLSPTRQSALSQQHLQQQQQQQLQQQQQHSGAAVVSSSAPTPSSSNTLRQDTPGFRITTPTSGTGGSDPNPIRRLGQNTSSGGTMVDHTKRNKLVTNNNNHSGAKDVGSRSTSLNHSSGSNSCDIVNGIVSSIVESLNPSPPQNQSLQQGAWMQSQGQHRLRSDFSHPQNNSGSTSGVAQRQRPLADASSSSGPMLFGRAAPVDPAGNTSSAKGPLPSDYQKSQQQKQQQQTSITNGNSRTHQDSGSTYLRPMPPLIPVTAMCSTPMIGNLIQSQQPGSKHVQQQLLGGSSPPDEFQQERDFEVYGQRRCPPRKSPRFLKTGQEEGNSNSESDPYSPTSSASSSPPLLQLADETTASAVDEIMLDQALRSTSVIRFAHRPAAGSSSSSSSPLPAGSSSQS